VPEAISHHVVPQTLAAYWRQRTRWSAGFQAVVQTQATAVLAPSHVPWLLRLELLLFSLGYLDRVALLAALVTHWQRPSHLAAYNIGLNLLTPLLQILMALHVWQYEATKDAKQQAAVLRQRLVYLPLFYALDMAATCASLLQKVLRQPVLWEPRVSS
jgi:cellulose synthase/poly-beta-1,6-N-acetylglucosamine synthase-like glycosyltransferase